ncbi:MAG: thioredoxin family protein [Oligoflexus sp.]|nr:thioredoxin family protein [Oligoflexus sp.]
MKEQHAGQPQPEVWFKGSVNEAFVKARGDKKMVFLYWGAIWCPPCNELKAQIFSKPRFAELMTNFIPVYLDGDTDAAQVWGGHFQASGYPTVLVLDENQKELFRLSTVLSIEEFDDVIQSVLASSGSVERAALAVSESRAKHRDLQLLAYSSWDEMPEEKWPVSRRINLLEQAFESADVNAEKSIFASTWISQIISAKEKLSDKQFDRAIAAVFVDSDSIWASREFIKYQAGVVAEWRGWKPDEKRYIYLRQEWLKAAAQLEGQPNASVSTKLWSVNPEVEFYQYEHPNEKPTQALRSKVEIAVRHADEDAKTEFDRHSVVSDAAYLLRQIESYDLAAKLLEKELKDSNTPWYYQSSLSALEAKRGNDEAAKKWSAAARKSVQGRASRVQWITSDLLLNAKDSKNNAYLVEITREFYTQALQLNDGFVGRNWTRAKKVQEALTPYKADPLFQKTFADFAPRCDRQTGVSKTNCQVHFAALK